MKVLGVDGCPGGWAVAELDVELGHVVAIRRDASIDAVIGAVARGDVAVAAIDMPIGLPDAGARSCDREARRLLGQRGSSVFPAPMRVTLDADDYVHACDLSVAAAGKKLSKQAWNLVPKIAEVDAALPNQLTDRVVEAHPELGFLRLVGEILPPKASPEGRSARAKVLRTVVTAELLRDADVPVEDALDAGANALTARHVHLGSGRRLGSGHDPTGKPMHIWW
jgi:predicted RNase H-like nuclease